MRVFVVERHELPLVDFVLVVPGGAAVNPLGKAGVADLMGQMLTEGTTSRTSLQIDDEISYLGLHLSAQSTWDATLLSLTTPTAQLDSALALFADITLRPSFPDNEFARIKQERLTALLQLKDRGPAIADRVYLELLYGPDHPYGQPALGTEKSISSLSGEDVKSFYKYRFDPNSAVLIAVGDITPEQVAQKANDLFGGWARKHTTPTVIPSATPPASTVIYVVDKPGAAQSSFRVGSIGVARATPDYFPIQVMNTILGGSFTSRLNLNLRETKGYTYGAFSGFDMRKSAGPFTARSEIVGAKTDSALVEFMKEFRGIHDTIPNAELTKAKQFLELQLPGEFETTRDIARRLVSVALYQLPLDYYNHYGAHIESVSQADVQRVARQYIDPDHLVVVIVGDRASIEPQLQALHLAPISVRDRDGNPQ
jgi:predicted Zn-dependent peptidase